jgi:hypothetical protein
VTAEQTPASAPPAPAPQKPNPIRVLYSMFATAYDLTHADGRAFATPRVGPEDGAPPWVGPRGVAQPLGDQMRRKIVKAARLGAVDRQRLMLSRADADRVLLQLEADAFDGPPTPLALRAHYQPDPRSESEDVIGSSVVIDLGDQSGRVVVIDSSAWSIDPAPPILGAGPASGPGHRRLVFTRSHATKPLPEPIPGGRLVDLAPLLGLDPAGQNFAALLGWVLGLPFDDGRGTVRPGLLLTGPPGSGKSTTARLTVSIVEPSDTAALGSGFGRNVDDDKVRALHRFAPVWDNVGSVSHAVSDALCSLVTGSAREARKLYSDAELSAVPVRRPVALTAVGVPPGLQPDALDRLVHLELEPVAERLPDAELQARFDTLQPWFLGALCSAVSAALDYVRLIPPPTQYRMASHAHVLAALDAAIGDGDPRVSGLLPATSAGLLAAYDAVTRRVKERTAADDVFGSAVLALLEVRGGRWEGKASELIREAGMYANVGDRAVGWPSPRGVPTALGQLREGLALAGVTWSTRTLQGTTRYALALARDEVASAPRPHLDPTSEATYPTSDPTSTAHALTCDNASGGDLGGVGGVIRGLPLFEKQEGEKEGEDIEESRRATPPIPPKPPGPVAAAPPGEHAPEPQALLDQLEAGGTR